MLTQNLGFPRIGAQRQLKKACENYWSGKISQHELIDVGKSERLKNWNIQKDSCIDIIPCNDFSFYDQTADMTFLLGAIPDRFVPLVNILSPLDVYFAMCRGYQSDDFDIHAMEMTKWFDTNYHYIVPEFKKDMSFNLNSNKIINEFKEAQQIVSNPKPVIIGPISYLLSGKEKEPGFNRIDLLEKLVPLYIDLLKELKNSGCEYVQIDEPYIVTDINPDIISKYFWVYEKLNKEVPEIKIILATYFDEIDQSNIDICRLPVYAFHVDAVRSPKQLTWVSSNLGKDTILSIGIIDGRNIWKNHYEKSLNAIEFAVATLGVDRIWLAPSCSLLHCPYDLDNEKITNSLKLEVKEWMSFAKQKLSELQILKLLATDSIPSSEYRDIIITNSKIHACRKISKFTNNEQSQLELQEVLHTCINRKSAFAERERLQLQKFRLPFLPTTTIGSFPQTSDIRAKRSAYKKGEIAENEYVEFIKKYIASTIQWQEEIGLDVLVHGEFERNDMVEYFGENLNGFAFTQNGWVQSYGSRAVKPPIIYGDIWRDKPITLYWIKYAQSLTRKKVKGMLTGPITILQWSFVRDDQPRKYTAFQLANAINKEVIELEKAGIDIIQIDEAALREGLPLKKNNFAPYLFWAVKAFKICCKNVKDDTQIHTHMCYSEFNDIIESIAQMDADVISIETSRSQMELLDAFKEFAYPNQIGPGVYDIHSPRIPSVNEIEHLIDKALETISVSQLWINPDCGLKTRSWDEVKPALVNMIKATHAKRKALKTQALLV